MSTLGRWQVVSFFSRALAMLLGLVQTFVILRLLTVSEWGLVQLAASIGGALGIYQHLGLASASTREISSAKDNKEIFRIFLTSAIIRYVITLPIAFFLYFFADYIATVWYHSSMLIIPLKIYAVTLLIQGFQSILNSVVSGTKRFKRLFIYQVVIAGMSLVLYIPLVYLYKVNGYFYAFVAFNLLSTVSLFYLAFAPLKNFFSIPTFKELSTIFRDIFKVSIVIYVVKILYTNWEKLGSNILGLNNTPEVIGIYAFALLYAKKLMNISDSVTDVNLPVLSELFVKDFKEFKRSFQENFDKIFFFILFSALCATYWAPEITNLLVGNDKYKSSLPFIMPVMFSFIFYSFINIVKSSILIPAKMLRSMLVSFILLLSGTCVFFFALATQIGALYSISWGMSFGSGIAFFYMVYEIRKKLHYNFFVHDHVLLLFQTFVICWSGLNMSVVLKLLLFFPYIILFFLGAHVGKIFDLKELLESWKKLIILIKGKSYAKIKK